MHARELDVYKRAFACAADIHRSVESWPKFEIYGGLGDQIRRASRGICANLVEGLARSGRLEQRRFLNIAIGSAEEVVVWLEFAVAFGYLDQARFHALEAEYLEIVRMLGGLMARRTNVVKV